MRRLRGVAGVCLLGTTAVLAGCASGSSSSAAGSSAAATSSPYRVMIITATSGPAASFGLAEAGGLKAAIASLNQSGGILGHKVVLTVANDQADPTQAVSLLQNAISSGNTPNLVEDGVTSNETLALLPALTQHQILGIGETGSDQIDTPSKYPYAFSLSPVPSTGVQAMISYVAQHFPGKKVGVLTGNDAVGQSSEATYKQLYQGNSNVVFGTYVTTAVDQTAALQRMRDQGVQVLILSGFGAQIGYVVKARATIGWNVPVVGDDGVAASALPSLVGAAALNGITVENQSIGVYQPPAQQSPALQALIKGVQAQGPITQTLLLYAFTWDIMQLVNLGAEQAHSITTPAIALALEHLKQPAQKPYVSYNTEAFTTTQHMIVANPSTDFIFGPANVQVVDGLAKW
jgi:branched-chain amino acid transport system substrate-binding protein